MVAQNGRECADPCKLQGEGCIKQATGSMALGVVMAMDRSFASAAYGEASVVCHDRGLWLSHDTLAVAPLHEKCRM